MRFATLLTLAVLVGCSAPQPITPEQSRIMYCADNPEAPTCSEVSATAPDSTAAPVVTTAEDLATLRRIEQNTLVTAVATTTLAAISIVGIVLALTAAE